MIQLKKTIIALVLLGTFQITAEGQVQPDKIQFVRQGTKRLIFDREQSIPMASLNPEEIIGMKSMHPVKHHTNHQSEVYIEDEQLVIESTQKTETGIWFGGFNPFSTYSMDISETSGEGQMGFEFSDPSKNNRFIIALAFREDLLTDVYLKIYSDSSLKYSESIAVNTEKDIRLKNRIILQMLGSGLTVYMQDQGIPNVIGQSNFNEHLDLRKKKYIHSFQSSLFAGIKSGEIRISHVESALSTGVGLADIRAITYENGEPFLEDGRLWYTMSIRGRELPQHLQGIFSMNPSVFDLELEGIVVFDRNDGLLRNEIASHIFYDRRSETWRGLTTGFSAFADPAEEKQLLAIESNRDPRFGFSIMKAEPFGVVGDVEDPHILYDKEDNKWRMFTCKNISGYKGIMLESEHWNRGYERIAGPVKHNSTGTSIQKIGNKRYCFSGSSEREVYIYSYPYLKEIGTLKMDLPPWDKTSGTRIWPNIVQLPEGYPFRYIALMMDRYNHPGLKGPNWSYGAIYLYHGWK